MRQRVTARSVATVATLALAVTGLAACGGNNDKSESSASGSTASAQDGRAKLDAALQKGGDLTWWTWTPSGPDQAKAFMAKYPNVKVKLDNVGGAQDTYQKLTNAIKAGSGAPDVSQIEYYALPQYTVTDSLLDLAPYGLTSYKDEYSAGPWNSVTEGSDHLWALPQDSGPMAMFYNKATFDKAGISEAPKTWDEFYEDAKKIHALGDNYYIMQDSGDPGFVTSMIWQAGGHPFTVDGTNVKVDFTNDEGTKKFTTMWDKLISEGLLNTTISGWSDAWFQGFGDGTLASVVTGAWMPGNLIANAPAGKGNWRVAPIPTYDGQPANAENGGSSLAVMAASSKQALAYSFVQFCSAEDGVPIRIDGGAFPSTTAELDSEDFLGKEFEYFGGQKANEVLAQAAKDVLDGWQYLPFQVYANSVFNDAVGPAYSTKGATTVADGLATWQKTCITYGNQQGFTTS